MWFVVFCVGGGKIVGVIYIINIEALVIIVIFDDFLFVEVIL